MKIHTLIVTAAVALSLAVPAVAGAAHGKLQRVDPTVVTSVYPGTSAISGSCTLTHTADYFWSYQCPGGTGGSSTGLVQGVAGQVTTSTCTLTVASGSLWTYSCSNGISGMSRGTIPSGCSTTLASGYRWMFSCPGSAFGGSSPTVQAAAPAKAAAKPLTPRGCAEPVGSRSLAGLICAL